MLKINEVLKATQGKLIHAKRGLVLKGFSIDTRTIKHGEIFIAIKGDNFDGHTFIPEAVKKGASCIIKDTRHLPAGRQGRAQDTNRISYIGVKDTTRALADIALYVRKKFNFPVIAISGSNGKTTTKEMIAWVLSEKFNVLKNAGTLNNHIGLPLTLLKANAGIDIAVLELGANHFNEIKNLVKICLPNIGVITNIGPSHLEYFGDLTGVFREKYSLIKNLEEYGIGILNNDDFLLRREILKKNKHSFIFSFGIRNRSDFFAHSMRYSAGKTEFFVHKQKFVLNTWGGYNIYNAMIAIVAARIFGLSYGDIAKRIDSFDFPQGRLKIIKSKEVTFIDDTYNSNPLSLKAALDTLGKINPKGRKIVVMGDMLELGHHKEILHRKAGHQAAQVCDIFIGVGPLSKFAADAARTYGTLQVFTCATSREANGLLFNKIALNKDDLVLVKGSRGMKMEGAFR